MYGYSNDFICLKFGSLCALVYGFRNIFTCITLLNKLNIMSVCRFFFQAKRSYQDNGSLKERQLQRHVIVNNLIQVLNETELSFP